MLAISNNIYIYIIINIPAAADDLRARCILYYPSKRGQNSSASAILCDDAVVAICCCVDFHKKCRDYNIGL